jgi:hypothetical protein
MTSFNATTAWETWWRSEDMYSRNHPMFGAIVSLERTQARQLSIPSTLTISQSTISRCSRNGCHRRLLGLALPIM